MNKMLLENFTSVRGRRLRRSRGLAVRLAHETLEQKQMLTEISFTQHVLANGDSSFVTTDIDGDGDLDIVTTTDSDDGRTSNIEWHENSANGKFDRRESIASLEVKDGSFDPIYYFDFVAAADVNSDGLVDIVAQLHGDEEMIVWYENQGTTGSFSDGKQIGVGTLVANEDFDRDGDIDLLVGIGNSLTWLENTDGQGATWAANVITSDDRDGSETTIDFDGDGDVDLLNGQGVWYENDGTGRFERHSLLIDIGSNYRAIDASDLDGDGDMDIVAVDREQATSPSCQLLPFPLCEPGNLEIVWYENTDGRGSLGDKQVIGVDPYAEQVVHFIERVTTHDIDGDGDQDVLVVSTFQFGIGEFGAPVIDKLTWYENIDNGSGFSDARVIPADTDFIASIAAVDLDNDGDEDLVVKSLLNGDIAWFESNASDRDRVLGDANGDGVFDSGDLVAVFSTGEYEDGIENNSTFEEGDWNGDGEFDSSDLVAAFKTGTYLRVAKSFEFLDAIDWLFDVSRLKKRPRNWRS